MIHSEQISEIATALAKAQGAITGAVKDSANPFFKSKYADLASVWDACRKPLSDNGLAVIQSPEADGACVTLETILLHTSGQWFRNTLSVSAKDDSPQSIGSAITYLRRYVLQSFAGVAPEDDDAEAAQGRGYAVQAPAARGTAIPLSTRGGRENASAPSAGDIGHLSDDGPSLVEDGQLRIRRVETTPTKNPNVKKTLVILSTGETYSTINPKLASLAEQLAQEGAAVTIESKPSKFGADLVAIHRGEYVAPAVDVQPIEPLDADSIPF